MSKLKLITQSHHGNGPFNGLPFSVAIFQHGDQRMLGIVVDHDDDGTPRADGIGCFVLDLDKAAAGDIAFGSNSFDGEYFDAELRDLIKNASDKEYKALCKKLKDSA